MQPVLGSTVTRSNEFSRVSPLTLKSVGAELPPRTTCSTSYPSDGTSFTSTSSLKVWVDESFDNSWNGRGLPLKTPPQNPPLGAAGFSTYKTIQTLPQPSPGVAPPPPPPLSAYPPPALYTPPSPLL